MTTKMAFPYGNLNFQVKDKALRQIIEQMKISLYQELQNKYCSQENLQT